MKVVYGFIDLMDGGYNNVGFFFMENCERLLKFLFLYISGNCS